MSVDQRQLPAPWGGSTSRSLLSGAQHDDPAAWARLFSLYAPLVAAWCRRGGVASQDVIDVLQDVFAAVARNLTTFRKEQPHDTFRAWLATITRNKVRDYYRRQADRPCAVGGTETSFRLAQMADRKTPSIGDSDVPEDAAFSEVIQQALVAIRGEFQQRTWQAFWGVVVEGRSAADVAADLSMQPGAVRVAKSRILSRLRRELGDIWN